MIKVHYLSDDTLILETENHKDIDNDLDQSNGLENFDLNSQTLIFSIMIIRPI